MYLTRLALAAAAGLALLCPACGPNKPKPVKVHGKVIDSKGKDLSFDAQTGGRLGVDFYKIEGDAVSPSPIAARVESDGRFEADLEPGKYRVSVVHYKRTDFSPDGKVKNETYKGKFSGEKSPIIREITGPTDDLVIDLAKEGG
jgi:hypothetical protein